MEQWEKNYYISSIAGANNGSSLVVMSKGLLTLKVCYICWRCCKYYPLLLGKSVNAVIR